MWLSYNSSLSHLRRINTPIEKTGKLIAPRKLHPTQMGIMCPAETPEGASVGIVKNFALSVQITSKCSDDPVKELINQQNIIRTEDLDVTMLNKLWCKVFIHGDWYCVLKQYVNPYNFVLYLRKCRLQGMININISK